MNCGPAAAAVKKASGRRRHTPAVVRLGRCLADLVLVDRDETAHYAALAQLVDGAGDIRLLDEVHRRVQLAGLHEGIKVFEVFLGARLGSLDGQLVDDQRVGVDGRFEASMPTWTSVP